MTDVLGEEKQARQWLRVSLPSGFMVPDTWSKPSPLGGQVLSPPHLGHLFQLTEVLSGVCWGELPLEG